MSFNMEAEKDIEIYNLENEMEDWKLHISKFSFMLNSFVEEKEQIEKSGLNEKNKERYDFVLQGCKKMTEKLEIANKKYKDLRARYDELTEGKMARFMDR